jgi:beta-ribofuranosylaminobenzene 5'-phosphate synthase
MRGDLGRLHGSIGVAIKNPKILLEASRNKKLICNGAKKEIVFKYAKKILIESGIKKSAKFKIISDIPSHMGFGSGTQLALAVGKAISNLYDLDYSIDEIALIMERSKVSGVGTYAFKHGGFIIDGGHQINKKEKIPPEIFRIDFPDNWYLVIGLPNIKAGKSGKIEKNAFKEMEPPPESLIEKISHRVLMQMIPSIIETDILRFGEAMTSIDNQFGEYWINIQGGKYSHPMIESGINFLLKSGAHGAGQSSWGPAFYGLAEGEIHAKTLSNKLRRFLNTNDRRGEAYYTQANNVGAQTKTI